MGKKTVSPEEWKQHAIEVAEYQVALLRYIQSLESLAFQDDRDGGETPPPPPPPRPPGGG